MKPIPLIIFALMIAMTLSVPGQNTINRYEYWFDDNFSGRVVVDVTPVSPFQVATGIPTTGLSVGLHSFHIRFRDNNKKFSSVCSQYFHKVPAIIPGGTHVVAYEYWYDNDIGGKVIQPLTLQGTVQVIAGIPAAALSDGTHAFHIRFKDDHNNWSSLMSQFFLKVTGGSSADKHIVAYEYWFDNNPAGKIYQAVPPQSGIQLITDIQASTLTNGLHLVHIRFKDELNEWSGLQSHFFQKLTAGVISNKIYGYRYWFDSDLATLHMTPLTPPQTPYLLADSTVIPMIPDGNHTISFQFIDSTGIWSSAITDTFTFAGPIVNRTVSPHTIFNGESSCIDALETLTVGGNGTGFTVQAGGMVNLIAGLKLRLLPNTTVQQGGYLHGYLSPGSPYCLPPSSAPELKEASDPGKIVNVNASMVIYPNPTSGQFSVRLNCLQENSVATVKIYSAIGLQIYESTARNGRWSNISLSQYSPGIYLVQVIQGNEIFTGKVIRQ